MLLFQKVLLSSYFENIILLEIFDYEEAQKFCDNFELELVSDKLDIISAPWLSEVSFWLNSRINLTTGDLLISRIHLQQALELVKINENGDVFIVQSVNSRPAEFWEERKIICAINIDQKDNYHFKNKYVCKNDVFDEFLRVKIQRRRNKICEFLKLNNSFVEEFEIFNISAENISFVYEEEITDPLIFTSSYFLTGIAADEYRPEKSGFPWCNGHPIGLTPKRICWDRT